MTMRIWLAMLVAVVAPAQTETPPDREEQAAIIERVRQNTLAYVESLPNFICTQVTRRFVAPEKAGREPVWKSVDTLVIHLTYDGKKEDYRVVSVNGKPTDKLLSQIGGSKTFGDFASLIKGVFRAKSEAKFEWRRWAEFQGRRVAVLGYIIDEAHSPFKTLSGKGGTQVATWPAEGEVYADASTWQLLRLTTNSIEMPEEMPAREVHITFALDWQIIGGKSHLLPAETSSVTVFAKERRKVETRFTEYQKFSADAAITYAPDKDK
jgi:hypothetical protein